jgi:dienelactone hydrolase
VSAPSHSSSCGMAESINARNLCINKSLYCGAPHPHPPPLCTICLPQSIPPQLMSNLDFPAAVKELGQAVAHLKASGATKTGVVGFCMGGGSARTPWRTLGAPHRFTAHSL